MDRPPGSTSPSLPLSFISAAFISMENTESSVFKLFGKTIQTSDNQSPSSTSSSSSDELDHKAAEAASARAEALQEALPCPRCKSKETKFCYFNNYNVNQPRHFCRACHRYWTAGGTLRNVPVGAGRRRSRGPPSSGPDPSVERLIRS